MLFGGNLKDALAKYAGKKDETKPAETKAEQVPSAEKKESEEIEKNKLKRNEAVKLLVNLNASESSENDQAQMQTFLRNPEFTKLPLSAI
ncbi:hypothetical protein KC711_00650 [Candidatus Peregrinibacteria bacterium]|nr:hypothetical protein [Candidatus Peregrinibacteria bacterium]